MLFTPSEEGGRIISFAFDTNIILGCKYIHYISQPSQFVYLFVG